MMERRRALLRVARRWQPWALLAVLGAVSLHFTHPTGRLGECTYLLAGSGAAIVAWFGAARASDRTVGRLVALGVSLSALGDLIYQVLVWSGGQPDVSIADIAWLGAYVALGAALFQVLRRKSNGHSALLDALLDVAVLAVLVLLVEWEIAVESLVADGSSPVFSRVVWALYPACDALMIALVVRTMATRNRISGMFLLAVGALCWLLSDFGFLIASAAGNLGVWLDTGWLIGALLLATSTWRGIGQAQSLNQHRPGAGSIAVAMLPLFVPSLFELVGWAKGTDPNPLPLAAATVALVVLAWLRGLRLHAEEARARELVRDRERYFSAVAANSSDAVLVLDTDGLIRNDAAQFAHLVGSADKVTIGSRVPAFLTPVDIPEVQALFERALAAPGHVLEAELQVTRNDGRTMWLAARMVNMLADAAVEGVVINLHDVTKRKLAEIELEHQAFHDALTGLPNRVLFADRVGQALRRDRRTMLGAAVIYLDLDNFKGVNDSLGHEAGDELLCEIGQRLQQSVRAGDTVTRLGGDEFAILIEQSNRPLDEAEEVARRILQAMQLPVTAGTQMLAVSASLGIAVAEPGSTSSSLLRDADVAMYRAKASGRGRAVLYEPGMRNALIERLQLETDLVHALDRGELRLVYQPVVTLEAGTVVGFEALLRWDHPELGLVAPDRFIPIAEETGLIVPIGRWVLGQACTQLAQWQHDIPGCNKLSMAVNVSGRQIASPDLIAHVTESLDASRVDPHALILEMTETVLVQDSDIATRRLDELHDLGVRLAIDDFGTGYSSLSYLRRFPVDILKVDRSFVSMITDATSTPAIVRGLLDLGRTLGLETVAEGVEDLVQRNALHEQGCDLAQGYLFARPLTPHDAQSLLNAASLDQAVALGALQEHAQREVDGPAGVHGGFPVGDGMRLD
jgi:diguanylate cyclase (GGDEF)-like protein/PAS domain S-box-containing protein